MTNLSKILALSLVIIGLNACKIIHSKPQDTKLILRAEFREIERDLIREFRFFETGLLEETIIYSSYEAQKLFDTHFYELNDLQIRELQKYIQELSSKPRQNEFPWQEDFYKRSNILKLEYTGRQGLAETVYYYTGHQDSDPLFQKILDAIMTKTGSGLLPN